MRHPGDSWRTRAACLGVDPEVFMPSNDSERASYRLEEARESCSGCPVTEECLAAAIAEGDHVAIRGGLTPTQRRRLP